MLAIAVLLPPLALLLRGRVFQALLCLILQVTVIGWIPAALWAVLVVNNDTAERRHHDLLRTMRAAGARR